VASPRHKFEDFGHRNPNAVGELLDPASHVRSLLQAVDPVEKRKLLVANVVHRRLISKLANLTVSR
jgi:hypothetical protein